MAVAVIIQRADGRVLLIRRAKDPARGRWAPPGGFIDIGETAEHAAVREIREEVGLELAELTFLCSQPNDYPFADVTYPVLDLFFEAHVTQDQTNADDEEVTSLEWIDPDSVLAEDLAFPSMQAAWRIWAGS
ncbi:MAG TPA: NUDIX domain-containing protein [Verrucomicrobiota bacterium]|nr:NUDIX domain-containing protein [Verrucomicrobiota bacterium]